MDRNNDDLAGEQLLSGRYFILLVALLLLAVLQPIVASRWLLDAFFTLVLLAAVWSLRRRRWQWTLALGLAVPDALLKWSLWPFYESHSSWLETSIALHLVLNVLFLGFITLMLLGNVLRSRRVTTDTICGAICAYVLLGIVWAVGYSLMEFLDPGSFSGIAAASAGPLEGTAGEVAGGFGTYIYYSFVTFSTLGYGDITPVSYGARTLAWLEAVTGQLFLAVLIARLMGLYIVHEQAQSRTDAAARENE